jgi:hypothetical protein
VYLNAGSSTIKRITIYNIRGELIQSIDPNLNQKMPLALPLGNDAGIYFLKMETEAGIICKKIIRQ